MKGFIGPIAISLVVVVGTARLGSAADLAFVEYERLSAMVNNLNGEMERLRADNADLRARLDSSVAAAYTGYGDSVNLGESCESTCCNSYCFEAGFAAVFLRPHFDNNVAYQFVDVPAANVVSAQPFNYDFEIAPRTWLAWTGPTGLGLRTSYFGFDHSASRTDVAPAAGGSSIILDPQSAFGVSLPFVGGDTVAASHSLDVNVLDLEATQTAWLGEWELLGSFGVRYASFEQDYLLTVNAGPGGVLASGYQFNGIGPTVAFEMYRSFGSAWTLFSVARGSILFGESDWHGGDPTLVTNRLLVYENDGALTIGEFQAGVRYNRGAWFLQSALEGQAWLGTESITRVDEDMVLAGFSLGAGLQY
jgi:hypothetical protein